MRKFLLAYTMLAALGAPSMADPFVSGSEPGWGKHMSAKQRRAIGDDDVRTALKHNHKPDIPTTGVPGYAFKLLTIWQNAKPGVSTVKSERFGVYVSMQECDMARAAKIAELDATNLQQPHSLPGAPIVPTTTSTSSWNHSSTPSISSGGGGAASNWNWNYSNGVGYGQGQSDAGWGYTSIGSTSKGGGQSASTKTYAPLGPMENMNVTFCEPGIYAPGPSLNIAQDLQTTGAAAPAAQTTMLEVPPGFVKHWVAPRPFARVIPGDPEAIEILSASGRDFVFKIKADNDRPTNILLVNDDSEVVANLRIVIPGKLNTDTRQGPDGSQVYRKDNPDYVAPKEKK